jgi:glycosyltransferase involved in cell wall biosynthesis
MAVGRPIVATDFPLADEVFGSDGQRAVRVPDHDPEAFARAVVDTLSLPDGGRAMTQRAAEWVRGRTWASRADAVLQALAL